MGKSSKGIVHIFLLIAVFALLIIGGYIYYGGYLKNKAPEENADSNVSKTGEDIIAPHPSQVPSPTPFYEFEIDLPEGMKLGSEWGKSGSVSVKTTEEIEQFYNKFRDDNGCPGSCSYLIKDNNLERQFAILRKISSLDNCKLTREVEEEIISFKLFAGGIETKDVIDVVWNDNLKECGLKFVGTDGYDVSLSNYEYQVGFIKEDIVIEIDFNLFPMGVFDEIDQLWSSIGYDFESGVCAGECSEKEVEYFESVDYEDPLIQKVIEAYDDAVLSFRLKS